ncbi:MAG: Hsp33 family molecular chaperone HslO [Leptospirales bacterium]
MGASKKNKYLRRDRVLRAITEDGQFRAVIIKATDLANTACKKHELNPLASLVLSELFVASLLATVSLKGEERISLRIDVDGPVKYGVVEANAAGEVRGYLGNNELVPESDDPIIMKKIAIGKGKLSVSKTLHSNYQPVTSVVELTESVIAKDLARYFALSEQVPTAVKIGVRLNENFTIQSAFGLLLQALPDADEETILELENDIVDHPDLGALFEEEENLDLVLNHFLKNQKWVELAKTPVDFFCRCGKDRFLRGLQLLSMKDLIELASKEQELVCQYCNEKYIVSIKEIQDLIENKNKSL